MWNIHDRWAIFISGRGSNLQSLLDLMERPAIKLVLSSSPKAVGLKKAQRMGIQTRILDSKIQWEVVHEELKQFKINKIFLLGFMKIIPESFIQKWTDQILNIHPSLLPKYVGLHAMERSYEDHSAMGPTIHQVIADLDAGSILRQREILDGSETFKFDFESCARLMTFGEHQLVRETFLKW